MYRTFILLLLLLFVASSQLSAQENKDTLVIGYTRAAPFILLEDGKPHGISIWLWERVADDLQIPYRYELMDFRDMLEALQNGTIDLSINPLTITSERSKVMDFTYSFFASNSTVAIQRYSSLKKLQQFLFSFFSLNFLKGMLALIAIIGFFGLLTWLLERKHNPVQFRPGLAGIWDGLWWSAVTMTTVGYGDKSPKSPGGKIIALIWMFSAIMFISGFTASIASSLTINQISSKQKSLDDFKDKKVGTIRSSSAMEYLNDHFFKQVVPFDGLKEGLDALSSSQVEALLYDEPILRYRINESEVYRSLEVLTIQFDLQFYAFAFAKGREKWESAVSQKILESIESHDWKVLLAEYDLRQL